MPDRYVFLDLETTGPNPLEDRILEVGLVEMTDGGLEEWNRLVDPGVKIPPPIERLTGIRQAMVEGAPAFAELAESLLERLDGKVLVAHNARFDYGFLKNEFARLGVKFQARTLCTVRLSRKLYPHEPRHNLDSLIARHGLACSARHRALGDAQALWEFWQVITREFAPDHLEETVRALLRQPSLPPALDEETLDRVPDGPGVYLFYGDNDLPLYIGKAKSLRTRVRSHFSGDHRAGGEMQISQQIKRLEWVETAGELGALLLEARLVKERQPLANRKLRRNTGLCAFVLRADRRGTLVPKLLQGEAFERLEPGECFGAFRSRDEAQRALKAIVTGHGLCPRLLGLEPGAGPLGRACFAHQIKLCRGACAGLESADEHNERLAAALAHIRLEPWPHAGAATVRETHPSGGPVETHVFHRWRYLGTARDEAGLQALLRAGALPPFDLDQYKLLVRYVRQARPEASLVPCPVPAAV